MSFFARLKAFFLGNKETEPSRAYDLWSEAYDAQPGNLMLDMDEEIFTDLLNGISVNGKTVADIGCGTGRHWKKLQLKNPNRLIGFDVSQGMLEKLKEKFPGSETHILKDHHLSGLGDRSVDLLVSTLTIAHIPDLELAWNEWNRVLRPGAELVITDYHPEALAKGGKRTFRHGTKLVAVRNHIYPIERIRSLARQLGWKELRFTDRVIGDPVKGYYEKQNALHLFEQFREVPIIYGIHLKKADDPA